MTAGMLEPSHQRSSHNSRDVGAFPSVEQSLLFSFEADSVTRVKASRHAAGWSTYLECLIMLVKRR
jgi:hypothetical protein